MSEAGGGRRRSGWGRWLTEGLVIVASILVAFALDAWWDERVEDRRGREALVALGDELQRAQAELDSVLVLNNRLMADAGRFLTTDPEAARTMPRDSMSRVLAGMGGGMVFNPSQGATQALLAGGLDLVDDAELRARIAAWPGVLDEIAVDQDIMVEAWVKVTDARAAAGLLSRSVVLGGSAWTDEAKARQVAMDHLGDPALREAVAGMTGAVFEVVEELDYVARELAALREQVAAALER